MDNSAEECDQATPAATTIAGEIQQQQGESKVRRRLVQSTLLPHKSAAFELKSDQKSDDKECNGEDKGGDDVLICESQGKPKRGRKRKESPLTKAPKAPKEVKEKSSPESTPDKDATPKKTGKRAPRKNVTPRKNSTPRKNVTPRKNSTPKKNVTPKKNGIINGETACLLGDNGDALPQIPNLRLEAKMMAEENLRVFGGKQIHPFFLSRNSGHGCHEKTIQRKARSSSLGPIHVFESEQDGAVFPDWRDWNFCEESRINTGCTLDGPFSSIFECTVKSLSFYKLPNLLHPSGSSPRLDKMSSNEASADISPDEQVECYQPVENAEIVDEVAVVSGCLRKSEEQQGTIVQERIMPSHDRCANQLDSRLWTDKYQPQKVAEICGNYDSVKFLSEWLLNWCQKGPQAGIECSGTDEYDIQDPDYHSSDSETISEEDSLKNILLITGPVGSGKSAAVYACAKEHGFRVLEANASECRNGAVLKERFGALESQSTLDSQLFQWSQESSVEFQNVDVVKSPTVIPHCKALQEIGNQMIEVIPIPDEDILHEATKTSDKFVYKDNVAASGQEQFKPLILFEDVDVVFAEDRGFVSAIQQIADKVKAPMILTSNSDKPVLPDNLDRLELCFKMPLQEELLQHLHKVCAAEKINVHPHLAEELIEFCHRDIRKSIMHLQFRCQGEQFLKGRGREINRLSSLPPFDFEAGHQMLPKMIPWDFPSQLSELVEKEVTMSISTMEFVEDKFDDTGMQKNLEKCIYEPDIIEAKKKAMLSMNCFDNEYMDFIDLFDSSSDPLPFSQRNSKRKLVVMSSDSEDESLKEGMPTTPDKDAGNELCVEIEGSRCLSIKKSLSPLTDLQLCSGAQGGNLYQYSDTQNMFDIKNTCMSFDVSCVPESSFVPETEINEGAEILFGMVSCGQVGKRGEILEEASVSNELRQHNLATAADMFVESKPKLHKDTDFSCDVIEVSHEEVEDSQSVPVESITREHQLMDECSCIDFSRNFKPHEECIPSTVTDIVRKSWKKLRDRRADLRNIVAAEHKYSSEIMELACRMSNLISEAEPLHIKCQSLDSLGLPMIYSEESEAFSWCNEQLQMASSVLEHGFCFYAKDIATAGVNMGFDSQVNFTSEMPSLSRKPLDVGVDGDMSLPEDATLPKSENNLHLHDIIRSMVPPRVSMGIKDVPFCEYLSSLGHMSRSESSRVSEGVNKNKRRRGRAARNYLSTGTLTLSPEEISLLGQCNAYRKSSNQSTINNKT
ncbi:uncharacterized protein LOC126662589 isoform X2 [Mercurialis annua]|uniref:uncharacterized protein LOC126662589 isoform X2 n=1 Tax=Mercurialis annua TaxID=3986 RepID=UPI00215F0035|nr:uncharacterized protein LOC126662589 isoform X2 [Mercurialis annua]